MTQGEQPAPEPFQDRDAGRAQAVDGVHVDGGGQPGQRDHRRRGGGRDLEERVGVGRVAVVLRHQVDGERGHPDRRVGGHRGQAVGEDPMGVGAATPDVQGVLGHQALVEAVGQGREGGRAQGGEAHVEAVREVGDQAALGAGVVDGRDARARSGSPGRGEHGQGVAELGQVGDQVAGDVVGERLP